MDQFIVMCCTTQNAFAIENIVTYIFQYLDLKNVSLCRSVCQEWLDYASNHVDTFYLPKIIDHFIHSKGIAKYNINLIQYCHCCGI